MKDELKRIGDEFWSFTLESSPTNATLLGYHDYDAELEDLSREVEDEHIASLDGFAAAAETIDPDPLTADERISREVLMFEASTAADDLRSRMAEFAVDPFNGIQVVYQMVAGQIPITEPEHAEAMVAKWSKMGRMLDQAIGRLREGVATDRTPPLVGTEKTIAQLDTYLASPVEEDALVNLSAPPQWSEDEVGAWRETLSEQVRGWSRLEAIDYLTTNSPQAPNNIVNEVERYIALPGQALAYKTGQREMLRARARAEEALGAEFDIKAFHDTLLGSGSVPMPTMHRLIDDWVAAQ